MNAPQETESALVVADRRAAANEVVTLILEHPTGRDLPAWTPGAHVDLVLPDNLTRQYSCAAYPPTGRAGESRCCANPTVAAARPISMTSSISTIPCEYADHATISRSRAAIRSSRGHRKRADPAQGGGRDKPAQFLFTHH